MRIVGTHRIAAPRHLVWEVLGDPAAVGRCIPTGEAVRRVSPREAVLRVGGNGTRFDGRIVVAQADPPQACVMQIAAAGGLIGSVQGEAQFRLTEDGGGGAVTLLGYIITAEPRGTLVHLARRLDAETAELYVAAFCRNLSAAVPSAPERSAAEPSVAAVPAPAPVAAAPPAAPSARRFPRPRQTSARRPGEREAMAALGSLLLAAVFGIRLFR